MTERHDRRSFLQFLGTGLTRAVLPVSALGPLACSPRHIQAHAPFTPIEPTSRDTLVLPAEFTHDVVVLWSDRLPGTNARFGYNADYTAFIPTTTDGSQGVLFVNHETVSLPDPGEIGVYLQTFPLVMGRSPRVEDMMQCNGQLDHTETGAQMAARHRNRVDGLLPQLIGNLPEVRRIMLTQITRVVDGIKHCTSSLLVSNSAHGPTEWRSKGDKGASLC
jgi:hypothetical protein